MSADLHTLGVAALGQVLAARQVSSVEVTQQLLGRIAAQQALGAFLQVDADGATAAAQAADARRAAGDAAPLLGVPIAHKDIFVTQALPTTAGSRMLAGYRSPFDATVVARLAAAGTVTLGKLNCDEFAMGSANENSAYFPARNPWNRERITGGSSGGTAAAGVTRAAGNDRMSATASDSMPLARSALSSRLTARVSTAFNRSPPALTRASTSSTCS